LLKKLWTSFHLNSCNYYLLYSSSFDANVLTHNMSCDIVLVTIYCYMGHPFRLSYQPTIVSICVLDGRLFHSSFRVAFSRSLGHKWFQLKSSLLAIVLTLFSIICINVTFWCSMPFFFIILLLLLWYTKITQTSNWYFTVRRRWDYSVRFKYSNFSWFPNFRGLSPKLCGWSVPVRPSQIAFVN